MDYLVAESGGNCERAAVDQSARSCRHESARVANVATDGVEERIAASSCRRNRVLATRGTRCCHEVGEGKHVVSIVLRIRNRIKRRRERHVDNAVSSAGRIFMRSGISGTGTATAKTIERVSDTHLIEISIAGERQQAGVLRLPAEAADAERIVRFGDGHGGKCSTLSGWLRSDVV